MPDLLEPRGRAYLEVGIGQAPAVAELLRTAGLTEVEIRSDYAGIERVVRGMRA